MITRFNIEAPGGNFFQVQFTSIRIRAAQYHGTFTQKQRRDQHNLFCNSLLELSLQQLFYLKVKPYILRIVRDLHVCAIDTISKDNGHYTFIYELRLQDDNHHANTQPYISIKQ